MCFVILKDKRSNFGNFAGRSVRSTEIKLSRNQICGDELEHFDHSDKRLLRSVDRAFRESEYLDGSKQEVAESAVQTIKYCVK